ncbi:hypothetical protein H310_04807 [Aphanomyces invadans]|uniref:RRM domain-containing protein n=1 Tax=Aphanomyces invadans TaxID=157072 RepID=A0A024UA70_9STRA|nr:hypothetical protein H310_04807 [Aphanomyces invadans]ETW03306.1 hypothetical protein H310_04807 [Aphanomyces invadans]|eukprot:XP_008867535.1 hypothetical protein H310_04807 [Aphanomyces invadans]
MVDGGPTLDDLLLGDGGHDLEEQNLDPSWLDSLLPPTNTPPEVYVPEENNTLGALLAYSCEVESVENVVTLLKQGANPNLSFHNGKTAIEWATIKQNKLILEHLLQHDAYAAAAAAAQSRDQQQWTSPISPALPLPAAIPSPPHQISTAPAAVDESWSIPTRKPTPLTSTKRPVPAPEKRLESMRGLYNYERRPADPRDKSRPRSDVDTLSSKAPQTSTLQSSVASHAPTSVSPSRVHRSTSRVRPDSPDSVRHPTLYRSKSRPRSPPVSTTPFSRRLRSHSHARQLSSDSASGLSRTIPYHPSMDMCVFYVGNLSSNATDADVRRFFKHCGDIRYFRRGSQPQWGHITFATADEGVQALLLDGETLMGRQLKVRFGDRCNKDMMAKVEKKMRKFRRKTQPSPDERSPDDRRGRTWERRSSRNDSPERWEHDRFQDDDDRRKMRRGGNSRWDTRHKCGKDRSQSRPRNGAISRDRSKSRCRDKYEKCGSNHDRHRSKSHCRPSTDDRAKGRSKERTHDRPNRRVERPRERSRSHYGPKENQRTSAGQDHGPVRPTRERATHDSSRSMSVTHRLELSSRSKSESHRHDTPSRSKSVSRHDVVDLSMSSPDEIDEPSYGSRSHQPKPSMPRSILHPSTSRFAEGDLRHTLNRKRSKSIAPSFGHMQRHRSMSQHPQRDKSNPRDPAREAHLAHHSKPSCYGPQNGGSTIRDHQSPSRRSPPSLPRDLFSTDKTKKRSRSVASDAWEPAFTIPKRRRSSSSTAPISKPPRFQVHVSNVSKRANSDALRRMFSICGPLAHFHRDVSATGVPQSVVHVAFDVQDALKKALELDGLELCGRAIRVRVWNG